jgi:dTDP-4-amino-4,6-dideoxygalactose transaminase
MTALLLRVQAGDEVIVPSFAFTSTANAYVLRGARPVFVDVRPDTLNLDERLASGAVTSRTRAMVVIHYGGVAAAMDELAATASAAGLALIEDNAHGLFGSFRGKPLGALGAFGTLSFHETKNFTCGEGGALVVNDPAFVERAEIVREKGTNRTSYSRGNVSRYTWLDQGSSYLPSDLLAAVLWGQLERWQVVQSQRKAVWDRYRLGLADWAAANGVRMLEVPEGCDPAFHLFALVLPTAEARDRLLAHLRGSGILAVFHYLPLHLSAMGARFGGRQGQCPVTEDLSGRLARLPFFTSLAAVDQDEVIEQVMGFRC